ncbi:MAG: DUF4124 domain-containing protein [Desulfosarcina sp.]
MKKNVLVMGLILAVMLASPVCAEIYKYVDENGQKRWTDDLSQVPKEQRPTAQRMESEPETPVDGDAEATPADRASTSSEGDTSDLKPGESVENVQLSRETLESEKADLDTQYDQLVEERKQLEQMKSADLSAGAQAELNRKITAYNEKTEQYETRLNQFNERINTYNQQIMSPPASKSE